MHSSHLPALQEYEANHQDGAESSPSRSQPTHHQQEYDEPQSGHSGASQHGPLGLTDSSPYPGRLQQSSGLLPDAQLSTSAIHLPQPVHVHCTEAPLQHTTSSTDMKVAFQQLRVSDWNVPYSDIFEHAGSQDENSELGPVQSSFSCHNATTPTDLGVPLPSQQPGANEPISSHSDIFEHAPSQDSTPQMELFQPSFSYQDTTAPIDMGVAFSDQQPCGNSFSMLSSATSVYTASQYGTSQSGPSQPSFSYDNTSWPSASSSAPSQSGTQQSTVHTSQHTSSQNSFIQGDDYALGHLPQDSGAQGPIAYPNGQQLHQVQSSTANYHGIGAQFPASESSVPKADKQSVKGAYSVEEETYISVNMSAGASNVEVATALGRTPQGVYIKWKRMQGSFGDAHASDKRKKARNHGHSPGENQL